MRRMWWLNGLMFAVLLSACGRGDDELLIVTGPLDGLNLHLLEQLGPTLSAGDQMKVAILRSIIFNPDVVLLDEPTTNLDIDSIHALTTLIQSIRQDITFLIVSHNESFQHSFVHDVYQVGEANVQR